jgi:hypothetical protein
VADLTPFAEMWTKMVSVEDSGEGFPLPEPNEEPWGTKMPVEASHREVGAPHPKKPGMVGPPHPTRYERNPSQDSVVVRLGVVYRWHGNTTMAPRRIHRAELGRRTADLAAAAFEM